MTNDHHPGWLDLVGRAVGSAGGVAIITAASAWFFGQFLVSGIQTRNERAAFQREWMKSRGGQALVTRRQYVEQSMGVVDSAFAQIGGVLAASENLVMSSDPLWDPTKHAQASADLAKAVHEIVDIYNRRVDGWDRQKYLCGYRLDYYFGTTDTAVIGSWQRAVDAVDSHVRYAAWVYMHPPTQASYMTTADSLKGIARSAIDSVGAALRARKEYLWLGWDDPAKLAQRLGVKVQ